MSDLARNLRITDTATHPLLELTVGRFREFIREPEAMFWMFVFPILLSAGLGIAFRNRPAEVLEVAAVSRRIVASIATEKLLHVQPMTQADAELALRDGKVALVAAPGPNGSVVYRYDDTNPEARTARMLADRAVQRAAGRVDPVSASDRITSDPGSRYIDFLVPGLLGMNLMGGAIWSMGFAIVDARRRKLMKLLVATPMPRHYYLLSFILSRLAMVVIEVSILIAFGALVFGVPVRGSLFLLVFICVWGSLCFGAVALLISSRARTVEAASGMMNLVMVPMWILSGVFFSSQRFPDMVQPVIKALPLTALIDALRANMLQGAGVMQVAPQIGILAAWLVGCFALAMKLFRWR